MPAPNPMIKAEEMAAEIQQIIRKYYPEGMVEVLAAYDLWPRALVALGDAWREWHNRAAERYPLSPVVIQLIEAVAKNQKRTAEAAAEIAPAIRSLHRQELDNLEDPRKAMWDHRANRQAR